jgi:hypothetical protein
VKFAYYFSIKTLKVFARGFLMMFDKVNKKDEKKKEKKKGMFVRAETIDSS